MRATNVTHHKSTSGDKQILDLLLVYTIVSSARQNIDHVETINTKLPLLIVGVLSIKANVIVRTNIVVRKDVNIIGNVYLATESNQSDKLLDCGK